jgi:hypothetical protein
MTCTRVHLSTYENIVNFIAFQFCLSFTNLFICVPRAQLHLLALFSPMIKAVMMLFCGTHSLQVSIQ